MREDTMGDDQRGNLGDFLTPMRSMVEILIFGEGILSLYSGSP